jgi:fatty acid/phospholipid biosynthesis enzyme
MENKNRNKEKNFNHQEIEPCLICKRNITTSIEGYSVILEYDCDVLIKKGFYHASCLKDLIEGKVKLIQDQFREKLSQFTQGIVGAIRS